MISIYVTIGSKITNIYQKHNLKEAICRKSLKEYYPENYYIKCMEENMPNKVNFNSFSYFINHDLIDKIPSYKINSIYRKKFNDFKVLICDKNDKVVFDKIYDVI